MHGVFNQIILLQNCVGFIDVESIMWQMTWKNVYFIW